MALWDLFKRIWKEDLTRFNPLNKEKHNKEKKLRTWLREIKDWEYKKEGSPPKLGWIPVNSSYAKAIYYDAERKLLVISHVNRNTYAEYASVEPSTVIEIITGEISGGSVGKAIWARLRGRYLKGSGGLSFGIYLGTKHF